MPKVKGILIVICAMLFLCDGCLIAQVRSRYSTLLLEELAQKTSLKEIIDTLPEGLHIDKYSYKGKKITVIVRNRRVEHIGYSIFSIEQRQLIPSPIYNFLERYTLQMDLPRSETFSVDKRMDMDKVSFIRGNLKLLPRLYMDSTLTVGISNHEERAYTVSWKRKNTIVCQVFFPSSYELMHGSLMIENENNLVQNIKHFQVRSHSEKLLGIDEAVRLDTLCYVVKKGHNRIPLMANNIYYTPCAERTDSLKLLFTPRKPVESFSNLFCARGINNQFVANVTLRKYNFLSEKFVVSLNQLVDYFYSENCKPYFGLLEYNDKKGEIVAVVQMRNTEQAYEHLMKVTINVSDIARRTGAVSVVLTGYIATQKIKKLYAEDNEK